MKVFLSALLFIWGTVLAPASAVPLNAGDILIADFSALGGAVIKVDPTTGLQTVISSGGMLAEVGSVAIDGNGDILVAVLDGAAIIKIDPATGNQIVLSSGGLLSAPLVIPE